MERLGQEKGGADGWTMIKKIRILNIYIMGQVKMSHVYQLTTLLSKTKIKTNKGRKQ